MSASDIAVPSSLDLLDVAGNGMACERFLWIRGLSDPTLAPKSRVDLLDDLQRRPGELLHLCSSDGTMAATTFTIRDDTGAGSCYVTVFSRTDPGEPTLGDLVRLASDRARAAGVAQVRCGDAEDRPHMAALQDRHGFEPYERWRRFHVDTSEPPDAARLRDGRLPDDVRVATIASRPGLAAAAFTTYRQGLEDTAGDVPRPDETVEGWLHEMDSSPVLGRDLTCMLLDSDDHVLALVQLERLAAGSDRAGMEFVTVARTHRGRGLGRLAKQVALEHARELRIRRLHALNHESNVAICTLNESLGWTEDAPRLALRLDLD